MSSSPDPNDFRPEVLSVREREVLDLAVEGKTDEQIAQALDLSTSTVNSYWVRIRGKVGQLSRTEIVGLVLRHESGQRHADLIAEIDRLRASESGAQQDLAQSNTELRAIRGDDWSLLALSHVPEAMLVCKPPDLVIYANLQAQHTFAAEPGQLENRRLWELTIPDDQETRREAAEAFFQLGAPQRLVIGVEHPFYALRCDGTNFRGILIAERFIGPNGPMSVVTVREAMQDASTLLKMLRKPFALG